MDAGRVVDVVSSQRDLVEAIIRAVDAARMDSVGGYPTDWLIREGVVFWADLDPGKEYRRTRLVVQPVGEFIHDRACWLHEDRVEAAVERGLIDPDRATWWFSEEEM